MSVVLAAIVTGALTWAGERIVDKSLSGLKTKLRDSAAKDELTQIAIAGIEAGIAVTPSIGEDLRSETFIHGVVGPIVIDRLGDPSIATPSAQLAQQYIERFVAPWAKDGSRDNALMNAMTARSGEIGEMVAVGTFPRVAVQSRSAEPSPP